MHEVTAYIKELCELESSKKSAKELSAEDKLKRILKLRQLIPEQIISHYDRFVKAGKVPIVGVRNGVCMGCFVSLATGTYQRLTRQDDLNLCENCGRYIFPMEKVVAEAPAAPAPKRTRARRVKVA